MFVRRLEQFYDVTNCLLISRRMYSWIKIYQKCMIRQLWKKNDIGLTVYASLLED